MFTSYFNYAYKGKCLNSKTLTQEQGLRVAQMEKQNSNGKLDFVAAIEKGEKFEKNAGMKTLFKLQCNNLWGKFGQRDEEEYATVVHLNADEFQFACEEELKGNLRFVHPPLTFANEDTEQFLCQLDGPMKNQIKPRLSTPSSKTAQPIRNKAVASMVTSAAQLVLWKAMHALGENVLYHDTDSIICVLHEGQELPPSIQVGDCLGQWELEHRPEDGQIVEFVALGPKAYGYRFQQTNGQVKEILKVKGCNLKSVQNQHISFDAMVEMVNQGRKNVAHHLDFRFNRNRQCMKSSTQSKFIQCSNLKGELKGYHVMPFGYDRFPAGNQKAQEFEEMGLLDFLEHAQ